MTTITTTTSSRDNVHDYHSSLSSTFSRRSVLRQSIMAVVASTLVVRPDAVLAASTRTKATTAASRGRPTLDSLLYTILRVREAAAQETRLITTGKFKDVQRSNVKLAVKFMLENYRLNDAFVQASTYLEGGTDRRLQAGQIGQNAVQSLYTILEYFDSSDVQNLKVGSDDGMQGKEDLVLRGLDSVRTNIDAFLDYFPATEVDQVVAKIKKENELNVKEFDPALGDLVNASPLS